MSEASPNFCLKGRRALLTGATEGIGLAGALALASAGAEVVLNGLPGPEADAALAALQETGAKVTLLASDLSDQAAASDLLRAAGPIDILVSCAAIQVAQALGTIDDGAMDAQFALNFRLAVQLVQGVLPHMRAQSWGRIVTIGSVQQAKPHPDMITYAALKSAQENMVRNVALQVAADGVTVNNIAPGVILTRRSVSRLTDPEYARLRLDRIPARYFGEAKDLAGLIVLLSTEAGRYITGASIPVDGGMGI